MPTPLAGGQRKIICGANEFSLASGQGGGHLIFDVCFDFQCATPRGLIRGTTVWGNYPLLAANSIFHCANPRGLIRYTTVWGNSPLLAANSIFHCATPRGLIRGTTVWGSSPLLGLNSIFYPATPRGLIRWVTVGGNYSLLFSNIVKTLRSMFFSEHRLKIALLRIGKHCIVKNIASLRKVNIAHPYTWLKAKQSYVECLSLENFIKR